MAAVSWWLRFAPAHCESCVDRGFVLCLRIASRAETVASFCAFGTQIARGFSWLHSPMLPCDAFAPSNRGTRSPLVDDGLYVYIIANSCRRVKLQARGEASLEALIRANCPVGVK